MKLIDADKLMQDLRGNVTVDVTPNLEQAIEEEPVAFDYEGVMRKLEDRLSHSFNQRFIAFAEAIAIIRDGLNNNHD